MARGTDDPFAGSVLDVVSLNAAFALFESGVELEAFDGDGDAAESLCVLALGTDDDYEGASAVGVELVEVADAGEAEAGVGIEGVAGRRNVEAGVVRLPLPSSASHRSSEAASVGQVIVCGVAAGEAISGEFVEIAAGGTDVDADSVAEILSRGASRIGVAASVDEGIVRDAE